MDGFARRREQSKDDIRRAAWELFGQFGVDKVSVADIARKAGVSQATIYNNFGSKEALAREFVTASVEDLVNRFQEILAARRSYREKMEAFFQGISGILEAGKSSSADTAVFTGSLDLLNDPEIKRIREEAQEKMEAFFQGISGILEAGKSSSADTAVFTGSLDLLNDPEIKRIREEAQEKMTGLLLGLVKEGRQQKQVNPDVSDAALRIYFQVYMDVFTHPEFQRQYHQHPGIVQEMGSLMMHGLSGKRK